MSRPEERRVVFHFLQATKLASPSGARQPRNTFVIGPAARPLLALLAGLLFACGGSAPGGSASGGTSPQASGGSAHTGGSGGATSTGGRGETGGGVSVTGGAASAGRAGGSAGAGRAGSGGATGGKGGAIGTGGVVGGMSGATGGSGAGGMVVLKSGALFVSPMGSDSNPGTLDAPFLTVAKARDVVRTKTAGMTDDLYVYLRGGNYPITSTITFGPEDSGTNGKRIYYVAYPGETPVLNGGTRVTGWTADTGGVYKATLARTTKLRNLWVNDQRALLTKKSVTSQGTSGTYAVTAGQADWAWVSGSNADGAKYKTTDIPAIASNKDDLEIVNGTTWNENIVCVRDVTTTTDGYRALLFQQPYGAIAQLPGWNAGFSATGAHTVYNARELMNGPGQFYFDKTAGVLYYQPRAGEDMTTADVEAPVVEKIIDIAGKSTTARVQNLTFQGITFENTDWALQQVGTSHGKASVQGATVYIAYGNGDWHASQYRITDTLPGIITVNNAASIDFIGNVVKHGGAEGISLINDVVGAHVTGNYITDLAGSGLTIGHPQHIFIGDGGTHEKFPAGVEGITTKIEVSNNVFYNLSSQPGFGGHAGITAFFVDTVSITHNHIQTTAYNGINLGWGWRNFPTSTTCKNNSVSNNRLFNTLSRLHDSGAIYTIGQMMGTTINQNYVRGIPPATSGPTYGLHNDEGSAYITENDNVLDIDPGVKYTINCEDYGAKHDLTIRRTYATVNKMGATPPQSTIDPPVVVSDNVWPPTQYATCLAAGIDDAHQALLPTSLVSAADYVLPASVALTTGTATLDIRSSGNAANAVWLAPAGTTQFTAGATMTKAAGDATKIAVPSTAGSYKLHVVDGTGKKVGESTFIVRVK